MNIRDEAAKVVYDGDEPHAIILKKGTLKFYRLEPMGYEDISELWGTRDISNTK